MFAAILLVELILTYSYALHHTVLLNQHKPDVFSVAVEKREPIISYLSECEAMFDNLNFLVLNYSKCVVNHSLYSDVCSQCVPQYNEAIMLYEIDFGVRDFTTTFSVVFSKVHCESLATVTS